MKEILTERPYLFEPNAYITVCVEFDKTICLQKLIAAIQEAYKANEATMSKIVLHKGISYYEKLSVSQCKIEVMNEDWLTIIKRNERNTFALERGELVRTFITSKDNRTSIIIMAHHLVGDGKSILYFVKDIMNALSNHPLIYKPLTLLTKSYFKKEDLSIQTKLYIQYCKHKWNHDFLTWAEFYDVHDMYWASNLSNIQYITLSIEETKQVLHHAKRIGCSVNSYLVTMFLKIYQKKCKVGIPVSIRNNGNISMANLTSGISLNHQFNTRMSFEKNARRVHRRINRILCHDKLFVLQFLAELPPTLIDAVLCNTQKQNANAFVKYNAKIMGYAQNKTRNFGISNLTKIDIPSVYGNYKIDNIIFVPPAVSYCDTVIGISTINGKITISYHNMIKNNETKTPNF